ncbi:MAG: hypothetical protein ACK5QB_14695 [Pseudanabaena sp.]|jgi:hypothetical protein
MSVIKDIKGTTEPSFTLNAGASQSGANWRSVLQVPASGQTANLTFTLPPNHGTSGQILQTDGSGVLTWVTNTGGSGISEELAIAYAVAL